MADKKSMRAPPPIFLNPLPSSTPKISEASSRDTSVGLSSKPSVRIDLIDDSPLNPRLAIDEIHVDNLVESLEVNGRLDEHVLLRPSGNGRYELLDGKHLIQALLRKNIETVPADIRVLDDQEALKLIAATFIKKDLTDYERFKQVRALRERGAANTDSAAAQIIGKNPSEVSRNNAYALLPPQVLTWLDEQAELISGTLAAELKAFLNKPESHPVLVSEAVALLRAGVLKQSGVVPWLRQKLASPSAERMTSIPLYDDQNKFVGTVTMKGNTIKINTKSLPSDKVRDAFIHLAETLKNLALNKQ